MLIRRNSGSLQTEGLEDFVNIYVFSTRKGNGLLPFLTENSYGQASFSGTYEIGT